MFYKKLNMLNTSGVFFVLPVEVFRLGKFTTRFLTRLIKGKTPQYFRLKKHKNTKIWAYSLLRILVITYLIERIAT